MKANRPLWLTILFLAVQTNVGGQPALKTGVQTLPGTLPKAEAKGGRLAGDFDAGLAVLAAMKLPEMTNIDSTRVYVSGFSGGARVASYSSFLRPSLFSNVFLKGTE